MTIPNGFPTKDGRTSPPATLDSLVSRSMMNSVKTTTVIVVEGPTDIIALTGIVDGKTCDIKFLGDKEKIGGKQIVFRGMEKVHHAQVDNVIGIVDWDYEKILGLSCHPPPPPQYLMKYIFNTDSHDMNAMVAASTALPKMLNSCHSKIGSDEKKIEEILEKAITITMQIGLLRCLNADKKHRDKNFNFKEDIRFDPPHIRKYIEITQQRADLKKIIKMLKKDLSSEKQKELFRFISEKYLDDLRERYSKNDLTWQLCQGHDLFSVLYTLLEEEEKLEYNYDEFSVMLFSQFSFEDFKGSGKNLYNRIKDWERKAAKAGKRYRILPVSVA